MKYFTRISPTLTESFVTAGEAERLGNQIAAYIETGWLTTLAL